MNRKQKNIALGLGAILLLFWDKLSAKPAGGSGSVPPVNATNSALANFSYLGQSGLPRGMRNNNPGNLKISGSPWQGKISVKQNTDGTFEQFTSYVWGLRAMIKLLRDTYIGKWNLRTLSAIISKYAPNTENDSQAYINFVSQKTGIGPYQQVNTDYHTMKKIVKAMAEMENGRPAVDDQFFNLAWNLSL